MPALYKLIFCFFSYFLFFNLVSRFLKQGVSNVIKNLFTEFFGIVMFFFLRMGVLFWVFQIETDLISRELKFFFLKFVELFNKMNPPMKIIEY